MYIWTWTVCSDSVHHVHYIVQHWQFSVHMDLNSVFRQCTPCTLYSTTLTVQCTYGPEQCVQTVYTISLYSTTLTVQCTYGPEQCVQTVYTMYIIKYNIDSSEYIWTWTVCSDSVHHVHYIVHHWQFSVHMDLNDVFRQCTPCTLYSTTLTVQCTYGSEQCVQTVYTISLYSTTLTVQCTYGAEQCVQTVYTMYII